MDDFKAAGPYESSLSMSWGSPESLKLISLCVATGPSLLTATMIFKVVLPHLEEGQEQGQWLGEEVKIGRYEPG